MKHVFLKHAPACLMLAWPFAAAAQSSVADCERIKNDLAYNQCLASFGPKRGERAIGEPVDADEGPGAGAPGRRAPVTRRGGRQTAVFDVVSGRGRGARQRR